ncbi:MAG TPA: phage tail protein, partial [Thermomicrobiales bacterium]
PCRLAALPPNGGVMAGIDAMPPLQSGRFLVEIGSEVVANFQECTGLTVEVEVQEYVEGGNNEYIHKLPGRMKYTNITLKRGISDNPQFASWRPKVEGGKISVEPKNLSIILFNHAGETVKTWEVTDAYPVKWTGPDMRASSMDVAIETLELAHRGWRER